MPTYDYRCKQCGKIHEIQHGFNDPRPTTCPSCGGALARVFHPVGVVFKGSGFHKTDYASGGTKKETGDAGAGKSEPASAPASDTSKSEKPVSGAKAAAPPAPAKPDKKASETSGS